MSQIQTLNEYDKIATMADVAEECLFSLRFGSHYALKKILREKYGINNGTREEDIKSARQLCNEFMTAYRME